VALFKSFNSKGFLLLYLVVFSAMLLVWLSRQESPADDKRQIPASLQAEIVSPARHIPQFLLQSTERQKLTEQSLRGKWTFIYFTHPHCLPNCEPVLEVLDNLQTLLANAEQQFVVINFDSQRSGELSSLLASRGMGLPVFTGDGSMLKMLAEDFEFLYLREDDGAGAEIEQQHSLFLTDPKGRLYARFEPPFSSLSIQQQFFALRDFYARSE
jgi:cytochrome oxidase Cu insertion factor (SCO1/SenC/PrrC family)